jgi:hypothetical protein
MENRGPHRVQIRTSPSRRKGALPRGHTRSANNSSLTIDRAPRQDRDFSGIVGPYYGIGPRLIVVRTGTHDIAGFRKVRPAGVLLFLFVVD